MSNHKDALIFYIEGKEFTTFEQYHLGAALKKMAGIPLETALYLAVQEGYEPELIGNDTEVDLARKDVEHFFVKEKLKFTINEQPFVWYHQYIKGSKIRELGDIPECDEIYLKNNPPYQDELIKDDQEVDLARPGVEHFISKEKPFEVIIRVNGRPEVWKEKTISYEQVVALAQKYNTGNGAVKAYTVTYLDGPKQNPKGEMSKGDVVFVTNNMIFNAIPTDKS